MRKTIPINTAHLSDEVIENFWARVDRSGDCWNWLGGTTAQGYGKLRVDRRQVYAHRLSYALTYGDAEDLVIRHACDNPVCCRPDHLQAGTQRQNMADRVERGRCNRLDPDARRAIMLTFKFVRHTPPKLLANLHGVSLPAIYHLRNRALDGHEVVETAASRAEDLLELMRESSPDGRTIACTEADIIDATSWSRATVQRRLRDLRECGAIETTVGRQDSGKPVSVHLISEVTA